MTTREIPREQWGAFLEDYSLTHAGWLVGVDVIDETDATRHPVSTAMRLERIAPDRIVSGDFAIIVKLGGAPGEHLFESVYHPVKLEVEQTPDGQPSSIRIESADGMTTFVRPLVSQKQGGNGSTTH